MHERLAELRKEAERVAGLQLLEEGKFDCPLFIVNSLEGKHIIHEMSFYSKFPYEVARDMTTYLIRLMVKGLMITEAAFCMEAWAWRMKDGQKPPPGAELVGWFKENGEKFECVFISLESEDEAMIGRAEIFRDGKGWPYLGEWEWLDGSDNEIQGRFSRYLYNPFPPQSDVDTPVTSDGDTVH